MSQIIQMLVAPVLAVLIYTRCIHIAHVLALSCIADCARAFGGTAYQSLIPTLVGKGDFAQIIGPVVAGAALATLGMVARASV